MGDVAGNPIVNLGIIGYGAIGRALVRQRLELMGAGISIVAVCVGPEREAEARRSVEDDVAVVSNIDGLLARAPAWAATIELSAGNAG